MTQGLNQPNITVAQRSLACGLYKKSNLRWFFWSSFKIIWRPQQAERPHWRWGRLTCWRTDFFKIDPFNFLGSVQSNHLTKGKKSLASFINYTSQPHQWLYVCVRNIFESSRSQSSWQGFSARWKKFHFEEIFKEDPIVNRTKTFLSEFQKWLTLRTDLKLNQDPWERLIIDHRKVFFYR